MFVGALSVILLMVYGLLLYVIKSGINKLEKRSLQKVSHPAIAVIVAFKNESKNVEECVSHLMKLDYPKDKLEFLFVDDHSTDDTYSQLTQYQNKNIQVIKNEGAGKKMAIQTAVNRSSSKWIAVTDADCIVPETWLQGLASFIFNTSQMVLGPVFIAKSTSFLSRLQAIEFLGLQGVTAGSAGKDMPLSANAANMLFKKSAFDEIRPYESNYDLKTGDDLFLLMAITARYSKSVNYAFTEDAVVVTKPVNNWKSYIDQRTRWASKGSAFTDKKIQGVGLIVFLVNLLVIGSFCYGIILHQWKLALLPLILKLTLEMVIIVPMKDLAKESVNPLYYLISGLVYPAVVVYTVLAGFFKRS